jgi:SAM-dependent methyltransferase
MIPIDAPEPAGPDPMPATGRMEVYGAETADLLTSQNQDPLLRHLTAVIIDLAARHAPLDPFPAAIDIGCGVGRTALALAGRGYRVVGVDPGARVVGLATDLARRQPEIGGQVAFYVGDATAAPPPAWYGAFDLAVCSEVLEHVAAPEAVLAYAAAVLRPNGVLVLTTPHDRGQWTAMDTYAGHVTRFSVAEIRSLLRDWDVVDLATEGFPFQRTAMRTYDRLLTARAGEHRFDQFGHSPAYRAYAAVMPHLLRVDHALRRLRRGTTLVVVARRAG